MELKQFITEALLNIVEGVGNANLKYSNRFRIIGVRHDKTQTDGVYAEFDVSVVAEKASSKKIDGKASTPILSVFSGSIEAGTDQNNSLQNAHRLKFKIYISEK